MPVPISINIIDDSEWTVAPHISFKSKKTFDHSGNILNMIRDGGSLRGLLSVDGAGCFEVVTKTELREEGGDIKIGRGRKVPSYIVRRMIASKEIYVLADRDNVTSAVVFATATVDEIYQEGFPQGWCVLDKPYMDSSSLYKDVDGAKFVVCIRPKELPIERWVPITRAMALGAQTFDVEGAGSSA